MIHISNKNILLFILFVALVFSLPKPLHLLFTFLKSTDCKMDSSEVSDPYLFSSCRLPDDIRLWPSVGNGHISTVVYHPYMFMNGLYNGMGNRSHRAAIPSPLAAKLTTINEEFSLKRTYTLDAKKGVFQERVSTSDYEVTLEWYAHRSLLPLLVFEVSVERTGSVDVPIDIGLSVKQWGSSCDLDFLEAAELVLGSVSHRYRHGRTKEPETKSSGTQSVHIYFEEIPAVLTVKPGVKQHQWIFLASVHANERQALDFFEKGAEHREAGDLRQLHIESWLDVWNRGRIEVSDNLTLARAIVASQYYILSAIPTVDDASWPFIGLSPCGLAWGDEENYFGHVFWDQETWMYPPLLMLHAELGPRLLETRYRTISAAADNANETGYRGLRYPWESAFTGVETTESDVCASQEIHISGDISFAMQQYWRATGDATIFSNQSYVEVVFGIADFWISRLQYNETRDLYDINKVQPPDEWAEDVNNSAFTNVIASMSLEFAAEVAAACKLPEKQAVYEKYAKQIYIPFNETEGYHPEYDGYKLGTIVKQADVILMGFPFMWNMTEDVRWKDLDTYEKVTSPKGPAMSDSMFAIGWLELKQLERAKTNFMKMFDHIDGDFQVWTENKHGDGATNFITGMGGFLQALLFGYGGLRLRSKCLDFDPVLPPDCSKMDFIGLDYMGSELSLAIVNDTMTLTLTSAGSFQLSLRHGSHSASLKLNHPVTVARGKASIEVTGK